MLQIHSLKLRARSILEGRFLLLFYFCILEKYYVRYPIPQIALLVESGQHTIIDPINIFIANHVNIHTESYQERL